MVDFLGKAYPRLAKKLRKTSFASLPTAISHHTIQLPAGCRSLSVKHDNRTSNIYGGNKVRKLEYILRRAMDRGAKRVATFGAVGSNHALATAIHAKQFGLQCTCFLAQQKRVPNIRKILHAHLELGTEIVYWGAAADRLALYRHYLQNRNTWVIPLGGTCWLGVVGFVNAGLELAVQIEDGAVAVPDRIYIANGTMGSVAGLALGLALANLPTQIHAIRVVDNRFAKREELDRMMRKTVGLLNQFDPSIPVDLAARTTVVWRDDFYAGGYALVDDATDAAVELAREQLGLNLDTTYTGKAMAALLHDLEMNGDEISTLFWNTYNDRPLPVPGSGSPLLTDLPEQFRRYFK